MDDAADQRVVLEERAYALILGALVRALDDVDLAWRLADIALDGADTLTPPSTEQ